jgi:hypothetical protein
MSERVRYVHPDRGYEIEQYIARQYLTLGAVYTVAQRDVHAWSTLIYLHEHPGVLFNSVLFEPVEEATMSEPEAPYNPGPPDLPVLHEESADVPIERLNRLITAKERIDALEVRMETLELMVGRALREGFLRLDPPPGEGKTEAPRQSAAERLGLDKERRR